jgi:predicted nucleic acid-binding protein
VTVVVLDSWAILRYLEGTEPAATEVGHLLARDRPLVSWINMGEVFYVLRRLVGEEGAAGTVQDLRDVVEAELPTVVRVLDAARIKAEHRLAYADAFAAATAVAHGGELWTGDPELLLEGRTWRWRDLRS